MIPTDSATAAESLTTPHPTYSPSHILKNSLSFSTNSVVAILIFSVGVASLYNITLWQRLTERLDILSPSGVLFCFLLFLVICIPILIPLLALGNKLTLKPLLYTYLLIASLIAWFSKFGIVFDEDMIRNIFQTNTREALELATPSFLLHFFVYFVLPAIFIYKLRINSLSLPAEISFRTGITGLLILLIVLTGTANFRFATYFGRENRDLRMYINPGFMIYSLNRYIGSHSEKENFFTVLGNDAKQMKTSTKKTVGILIVGETARADHFSLNGYSRETNPELSQKKILNFSNVSACGTSTAYSIPCIFSFLSSKNYSPEKAQTQSNLLDVLETAGIKTLWRDNNSSCKGVCKRIQTLNFREAVSPESAYYHEGEYIDEILLAGLNRDIDNINSDVLVVLHQLGSHGPAYHRRYPEEFAHFQPVCASSSPHECSNNEVRNSYDNTILYTDYFLARTIDFLQENTDKYQSFLLYVSDHGESLGEDGVYLHGLPLSIAPEAQTHVPMLAWMSDELSSNEALKMSHANDCLDRPLSHDNLTHSVLSLFNVQTSIKRNDLDIFDGGCLPD